MDTKTIVKMLAGYNIEDWKILFSIKKPDFLFELLYINACLNATLDNYYSSDVAEAVSLSVAKSEIAEDMTSEIYDMMVDYPYNFVKLEEILKDL